MAERLSARREDAKVLLFDETGQVLVQRSKGANGANRWTFPGGRVEPGEDPMCAAERELHKESGIAAALKPSGLFDIVSDTDGDSTSVFVFWGEYTGQKNDSLPKVGEGWQMTFMRVSDVRDLDLTSIARQILVHCL